MKYRYMNMFTGEINTNLFRALKACVFDFIHYPSCRTIKIFQLQRGNF